MIPAIRSVAIALLPSALHVSGTAAAALAALLVLLSRERRAPRLSLPVVGFLVAGGLSVLMNPSATAVGTWAYWLVAALVLLALYVSMGSADGTSLAKGAAAANVGAAFLALYQVAVDGGQATLYSFHPNMAASWVIAALGANLIGLLRLQYLPIFSRVLVLVGVPAGLIALALTASRSGLLAAGAGVLVIVAFSLRRARLRALVVATVAAIVLGLALWQVDSYFRGPASSNLLTNSGFESGTLPWALGSGSERVVLPGGDAAVRLKRDQPSALLRYVGGVTVEPSSPDLELSLAVLPSSPAEEEPLAVQVAVDAYSADGELVSRLGVDGWTEDGSAGISMVGNRPVLPGDPAEEWQRVAYQLSPLPAGTARLSLEFQTTGKGTYGLVDDLMLAPIGSSEYVPGRRPGLFTPLAPTLVRLEALRRPLETSGGRVGMWLLGLDLAAARPVLGYGLGSSQALVDEYGAERVRRPLEHFHSLYIQLLVEGGSVLFATFLLLAGGLLVFAWRAAIQRRAGGGLALLASTVALLVQSAFDPVLSFVPALGCLWLVFCVTEAG